MAVKMPKILDCVMSDCSYNKNKECHAMAVTVGGSHPMCDTFFKSSQKGGVMDIGGVGACKVSDCKFNKALECSASGIHVGVHQDHADCSTFATR